MITTEPPTQLYERKRQAYCVYKNDTRFFGTVEWKCNILFFLFLLRGVIIKEIVEELEWWHHCQDTLHSVYFFRGCCEALLLNFLSGVDTVVILSGRRRIKVGGAGSSLFLCVRLICIANSFFVYSPFLHFFV